MAIFSMAFSFMVSVSSLSARFGTEAEAAFMTAWRRIHSELRTIVADGMKESGINLKTGTILDSVQFNLQDPFNLEIFFHKDYVKYLDEGYGPFNIGDKLLAGGKVSKEGYRYRRIPIDGKVITISSKPELRKTAMGTPNWQHPGISGHQFSSIIQDNIVKRVKESLVEIDWQLADSEAIDQVIDSSEEDADQIQKDIDEGYTMEQTLLDIIDSHEQISDLEQM